MISFCRRETWTAGILAALGVLLVVLRLHTYDEPLERDITTYAVIAHELLNGRALYTDVWDHKPPLLHATFAAAEVIAGYGPGSILLLNIGAGLATLIACYLAGSAASGKRVGGLVGAGLWTLVSGDLSLEANQPNTEVFLNSCLAFAFAAMIRAMPGALGTRRALIVGIFFAVASLYKQIVVVNAALLAVAWIVTAPRGARIPALIDTIWIAAVGVITWAAVCGYFATAGRMQAFYDATFVYNRAYSGNVLENLTNAFNALRVTAGIVTVLVPLALCTIVGLAAGLQQADRRKWILLLAFALSTHLTVALTGKFFAHYYQLWLPVVVIGSAWAIASLPRPERVPRLPTLAGGLLLVCMICVELPFYALSPTEWSNRKYGTIFVATRQAARAVDQLLPADATLYEWGNESGFYFETKRRPPTGVVFNYPVLMGPFVLQMTERLLRDLERAEPELLVLEKWAMSMTAPNHPFAHWSNAGYRGVTATNDGHFYIFVRKGSATEERLEKL